MPNINIDINSWKILRQRLIAVIRKEMLSVLKDPSTRVILVVPIILQSILFGYAATFNLDRVPYACIDQSHSRESTEFFARLDGTGVFYRVETLDNANQIARAIDSDSALMVISIGSDFADKLQRGQNATIQVITDGRNTTTSAVASGYINRIVEAFNTDYNHHISPVRLETISWYNPNLITRWTFLPGLACLLSFVQVIMLAGLSVAKEREQGTFDQLLVTPLSPGEILVGKALPPLLIGLFQSTLVLLICQFWFKIPMAGSFLTLYLTLGFFMLSSVGIGLSISAISKSMQQVMVYCFVLLLPMVLLSGFTTPVRNMPESLQILTYANPLRFALDSIKRIYLEGCSISDIAFNFLPISILAAITLPLAAWLFRHKLS